MSKENLLSYLEVFEKIQKDLEIEIPGALDYFYNIAGKLSTTIVDYRVEHKLSQKELAKKLNITQAMVSKYENGNYNISLEKLCDLCESLSLKVDITLTPVGHRNEIDPLISNLRDCTDNGLEPVA